jgi:hypothetical protein
MRILLFLIMMALSHCVLAEVANAKSDAQLVNIEGNQQDLNFLNNVNLISINPKKDKADIVLGVVEIIGGGGVMILGGSLIGSGMIIQAFRPEDINEITLLYFSGATTAGLGYVIYKDGRKRFKKRRKSRRKRSRSNRGLE